MSGDGLTLTPDFSNLERAVERWLRDRVPDARASAARQVAHQVADETADAVRAEAFQSGRLHAGWLDAAVAAAGAGLSGTPGTGGEGYASLESDQDASTVTAGVSVPYAGLIEEGDAEREGGHQLARAVEQARGKVPAGVAEVFVDAWKEGA